MKDKSNRTGWLTLKLVLVGLCMGIFITGPAVALAVEQSATKQSAAVQAVTFTTEDKFVIGANYYPGTLSGAGVLLLHDCSRDSKAYTRLAETLASFGLHTLALDFRGFGESVSDLFSLEKIKQQRKNLVSYQAEISALTAYWDEDINAAFEFLRNKVDKKKQIAIVGSGCSAVQAVSIAEKMHINSMVLITPKMSYGEKERYKNLIDFPSYFISSAQHGETHATATELFEWNGSKKSKIQIFKGDQQDLALLRNRHYLVDDIALWLKSNLAR